MDSTLSVPCNKRKGVSTYIAILILIVLVIAAGLLIWAYFMGYLGLGTPPVGAGKAMVIDNIAQQGGELLVYVKNVGAGTLRLSMNSGASVYVEESRIENYVLGGDASEGYLEETKTGLIRITIHPDWSGKTVLIKVVASDGTYAEGSYKIATPSGIIIQATAGPGGHIYPSGFVSVNFDSDITFTWEADPGYSVSSLTVNDVFVIPIPVDYTFYAVKLPQTIHVEFQSSTENTFTITASAGPGGSITPSGSVPVAQGSSQTFTIMPSTGYHIDSLLVDGDPVDVVTSYTFTNVIADHTISATFALGQAPVTYTITASAGPHGTINPSGAVIVNQGADQAFNITPDSGYYIVEVIVDSVSQGVGTSYTFTNVIADHTISATFALGQAPVTYTITASAGPGGTINPSGAVTVNQGSSLTFIITPSTGYHIVSVLVDGGSVGAVTSYTFNSVTASHTIAASFAINTYTITASAGPHGTINPSGAVIVNQGADQAFNITPDSGYVVSGLVVDGTQLGALTTYTFTNVQSNHAITASFTSNSGNKLVYTKGASQTIFAGTQSEWITIQRQTSTGTPITSNSLTVSLIKSSSTGRFTDPNTGNIITSITIRSGSSTASFCYMDTVTGTPTLTATASGYLPATTTFTITPGIATSFTPSRGLIPGSQVVDTARLVFVTSDASGTVTYDLWSGIYPSGTLVDSDTVTVTNGIVPNSKPFTTSSTPGAYYFRVSYSGDAKNMAIPDNRPEEFVVWPAAQTILLRPNGRTSDSDLGTHPSSSYGYQCVDDDPTNDGDSTYVYAIVHDDFWTDDTYAFSNPAHIGTVNYVTINAVGRTTGIGALQMAVTTHGQEYDGSNNPGMDFPLTTTYMEYTKMWYRNPYTGAAWTWQEIDDLLVGCSLYQVSGQTRCTQVYIEIYYTP
jgi:hypothetical protein